MNRICANNRETMVEIGSIYNTLSLHKKYTNDTLICISNHHFPKLNTQLLNVPPDAEINDVDALLLARIFIISPTLPLTKYFNRPFRRITR